MNITTPYIKRCRIMTVAFNNNSDVHFYFDVSERMLKKKNTLIRVVKHAKWAYFWSEVFGHPARRGSLCLFNTKDTDRMSWGNRQFNKKADLLITFLRSDAVTFGGPTDINNVYHDSRNIGGKVIIVTDGFLTGKLADIPHNVEYIFI